MTPTVAVLTASRPERNEMLAEACQSVNEQTQPPDMHLVGVDHRKEGAARIYNRLARAVASDVDWIAFLDDDDLFEPHHLATLCAHATKNDVVYGQFISTHERLTPHEGPFDPVALEDRCIIPIASLVRLDTFLEVGGFPQEHAYDWGLWKRLSAAGARFHAVDVPTWTWRIGDPRGHGNRSWLPEGAMP